MDRQIIYSGQIPLETDLLNTNKNTMIGLSKLAAAILGTSTQLNGLACNANSPAALNVVVSPGEIYSLQNIDGTAYSSIAADTTHSILKQGILLDAVTLSCPAPGTAGQSINYLVQVTYTDSDTTPVVLPYYNASNPSQAYSGPANAGTTNNTIRKGVCTVAVKAGIAATTGSQTTPSADAGYTGAYVVTVANGQTTIVAGNISTLAGAPFITNLPALISSIQNSASITASAGGTADAITGAFSPSIAALTNGLTVIVRAASANATTTPTFKADGTTAKTIVKGNNLPLVAGDIAGVGHWLRLTYDATLDKWELSNPIAQGRLLNIQRFTASGTYTPTTGATKIEVEVLGGGGGGGGAATTGAGQIAGGGGGGAGGRTIKLITGPTSQTVTVGAGGAGGAGVTGVTGGTSSFGAIASALGGVGGPGGTAGASGTGPGSLGGTASGGDTNIAGGAGTGAFGISPLVLSGKGADSAYGAGGNAVAGTGAGGSAVGFGSGGGGASSAPSTGGAATGGTGAPGLIIVREYS